MVGFDTVIEKTEIGVTHVATGHNYGHLASFRRIVDKRLLLQWSASLTHQPASARYHRLAPVVEVHKRRPSNSEGNTSARLLPGVVMPLTVFIRFFTWISLKPVILMDIKTLYIEAICG
jgi:hypothetical protein